MRKAHIFILFVACSCVVIFSLSIISHFQTAKFVNKSSDLRELVLVLGLTDITFSNDARYTRNPSQADLFSPFQDGPGSIEHFPSGSVVPTPDFSQLETTIRVKR